MPKTIDRNELKRRLDSGEDIKLIEVLKEDEYKRLHIRGAMNIPLATIGATAREKFSKDDFIVVYCSDINCTASPTAAEKLESFGFTNVHDYAEGKADWHEAGYPMEGTNAS